MRLHKPALLSGGWELWLLCKPSNMSAFEFPKGKYTSLIHSYGNAGDWIFFVVIRAPQKTIYLSSVSFSIIGSSYTLSSKFRMLSATSTDQHRWSELQFAQAALKPVVFPALSPIASPFNSAYKTWCGADEKPQGLCHNCPNILSLAGISWTPAVFQARCIFC